jgi:hypothetical protein
VHEQNHLGSLSLDASGKLTTVDPRYMTSYGVDLEYVCSALQKDICGEYVFLEGEAFDWTCHERRSAATYGADEQVILICLFDHRENAQTSPKALSVGQRMATHEDFALPEMIFGLK